MKNLLICLIFILLTSCGSDDMVNELQTGNLDVTVISKTNEPITGAIVTTLPETSEKITTATGTVSFNNIGPGNYTIAVEVPSDILGYTATAIVTANQTTSLVIEVGPEPLVSNPLDIDVLLENSYEKLKEEALFDATGYGAYWGDIGADVLYVNRNGGPSEYELDAYNFHPSNQIIYDVWAAHYDLIWLVNLGLYTLESGEYTSEQAMDENGIRAEFHFLRALMYFNLVKLFGNPVIATSGNVDLDNPPPFIQGRDPAYDLIINDLIYAETHLQNNGSTSKATKAASQALLGKVYLQMAGFPLLQQEKYALALLQFEKLEGIYGLEPNYSDIFSLENEESSTEVIFRIPFDQDGNYGFYWGPVGISIPDRYYLAAGFLESFFENPEAIAGPVTFPLAVADKRFEQNIATFSYENGMLVNEENIEDWRPYKFRKTLGEVTNFESESFDLPYLRYADVLLMVAEAENAINGPTAKAYAAINEVRRRAYGDTDHDLMPGMNQQSFLSAVLDERRWELCYEGQRKDDLIRTQELEGVITDFNVKHPEYPKIFETYKHIWPIPQMILDLDQNIQQNEGY